MTTSWHTAAACGLTALLAAACSVPAGDRHPSPWPADAAATAKPAAPRAPRARARAQSKPSSQEHRNRFEFGYRSLELREISSEIVTSGGRIVGEADIPDVDRDVVHVRYRGGGDVVGFHVGVLIEEFDDTHDLVGGEIGIDGTPLLHPEEEVSAVIDYELSFGMRGGDGDIVLVDPAGNPVARVEQDLFYAETFTRFGAGVDWLGAQLTGGIAWSALTGVFDIDSDDPMLASLDDEDADIDGFNVGGYVRAAYSGLDFPMTGSITGYFGEISGVGVFVGVTF